MNVRVIAFLTALLTVGCGGPQPPANAGMVVYKSSTCGCCKLWVQHVAQAGIGVQTHDTTAMDSIKERVGVPSDRQSCHTAQIGGYFIEGHVPVEDIKRLLHERPNARGLAVPGMPVGSPGMESPSGKVTPYDVLLIGHDGSVTVFAHHN
jgi:hypothetical protein